MKEFSKSTCTYFATNNEKVKNQHNIPFQIDPYKVINLFEFV